MSTTTPTNHERYRSELDHHVRRSKWHRVLLAAASLAQAVAVYFGLSAMMTGDGWAHVIVPIITAPVIGVILYLAWDYLITTIPLLHSPTARVAGAGIGFVLAVITVAASSWFIATAIGGDEAVLKHQRDYAMKAGEAEAIAYRNVQREEALATKAGDIAAGWRKLAQIEVSHGTGTGMKGDGPHAAVLAGAAEGMTKLEGDIDARLKAAKDLHKRAGELLGELNTTTDQKVFAEKVVDLKQIIAEIDGTSALALIGKAGIIKVDSKDRSAAIYADNATKELRALGDAVEKKREKVVLKPYEKVSPGVAVINYAGHVPGAWVTGVAIDVVPFLILMIMMLLHFENRDAYAKRHEFSHEQFPPSPQPLPKEVFDDRVRALEEMIERKLAERHPAKPAE